MRPILICVFIFAHTCWINATPHGYGAKSGAGAAANAGAAAGTFGDLNVPVSLPGGRSYSGSYSKSSSSSFAASSASSSAFSFSGSGLNGNSDKCIGSCQNKDLLNGNSHTPSEYSNRQNIAASENINPISEDSKNLFSGAKAAAAAQTGAFGSNNIPQCIGNNCPEKECKDANCNVGTSTKCMTGECNHSPLEQVTVNTEPDKQCASGLCGSTLKLETKPYKSDTYVNDNSKINCASGQCFGVPPKNPSSSSIPNCTGNECASSPNFHTPNHANPNIGFSAPASVSNPTYHASSQKCTEGQCVASISEEMAPISGISDIYVNTGKTNNSKSSYDTNIYGDLQINEKPLKVSEPSSDCTGVENCVPINPIFSVVKPNPTLNGPADTFKCKYPNNCNNIYNHAVSSSSGSVPANIKPVNFLTTPKQGPSCTSSNCESFAILPESPTTSNFGFANTYQSHTAGDNKTPNCVSGSCAGYSNSNLSPTNPHTPNYPTIPENKCSSPICASPSQTSQHEPALSQPVYLNGLPIIKPIISSVIFSPHSSVMKPQQAAPHTFHSQGAYPTVESYTNPQSIISNKPLSHQTTSSSIPALPSNNPFITASSLNNKNPNGNHLPAFIPLKPTDSTTCGGSTECSGNKYPSQNNGPMKPAYIHTGLTPVSSTSTFTPGITNVGIQTGIHSHISGNKLHNSHDAQYTGGFGGPPGVLKPNDFSSNVQVPNTNPASNYPTTSCPSGICDNNENKKDLINTNPSAMHNPSLCSNGNCDSYNSNHQIIHDKPNSLNGVHATAIAAASASAGAYTGGFGGPPGFLKPYDDGKISPLLATNSGGKHSSSTQFEATLKNLMTAISPSLQKGPTAVGAGAQAFAAAGASAGGAYPSSSYEKHGDNDHKIHNGCEGGCTANENIEGLNLGYSGNVGKADIGAATHAGSHAGAVSGANGGAFGLGRSFASSSATAHASAGAVIKGYGRK